MYRERLLWILIGHPDKILSPYPPSAFVKLRSLPNPVVLGAGDQKIQQRLQKVPIFSAHFLPQDRAVLRQSG